MESQRLTRRQFVRTTIRAAGGAFALAGSGLARAQDPVGDTLRSKAKPGGREKIKWHVEPFPLSQVRLINGPFKDAMEVNRRRFLPLQGSPRYSTVLRQRVQRALERQ